MIPPPALRSLATHPPAWACRRRGRRRTGAAGGPESDPRGVTPTTPGEDAARPSCHAHNTRPLLARASRRSGRTRQRRRVMAGDSGLARASRPRPCSRARGRVGVCAGRVGGFHGALPVRRRGVRAIGSPAARGSRRRLRHGPLADGDHLN